MACPHFYPVTPATDPGRPEPARTPLGMLFTGVCHADPASALTPDPAMLYDCCNFGYGRGRCQCFPEATNADAVRFSVHAKKLLYILERDYAPVEYGAVEAASAMVRRQAEVFLANYPR